MHQCFEQCGVPLLPALDPQLSALSLAHHSCTHGAQVAPISLEACAHAHFTPVWQANDAVPGAHNLQVATPLSTSRSCCNSRLVEDLPTLASFYHAKAGAFVYKI